MRISNMPKKPWCIPPPPPRPLFGTCRSRCGIGLRCPPCLVHCLCPAPGMIATTLDQWRAEAEAQNDMPTASVVHAYLGLLWTNVQPADLTPGAVTALLGNLAFVRARHGFGLGLLRSQLLEQSGEDELTPEARLVRFLQAQGIDTGNVRKEYLDRGRVCACVWLSLCPHARSGPVAKQVAVRRTATSRQVARDQTGQGGTESDTGRSWFVPSSGCDGG